jgi:protein SCO1/2
MASKRILRAIFAILIFSISLHSDAEGATDFRGAVHFEQHLADAIPLDSQWRNELGKSAKLGTLMASCPHILVFAYYRCPNLCTLVLNGLVQAIHEIPERLGTDYDVITVSINPDETPALALMKQRSYLAKYGDTHARGWHFLTGSEREIARLTRTAGFHFQKDLVSGEYDHPSGIIVLTPQGQISQYLFGIHFEPKALSEALQRAHGNRLGTLTEEILLYCLHYDPKVHKNGKAILALIRLTGLIGAIALIALLIHLGTSRRNFPT